MDKDAMNANARGAGFLVNLYQFAGVECAVLKLFPQEPEGLMIAKWAASATDSNVVLTNPPTMASGNDEDKDDDDSSVSSEEDVALKEERRDKYARPSAYSMQATPASSAMPSPRTRKLRPLPRVGAQRVAAGPRAGV
eukprot:CAMPEP_0184243954 /NCGR_PEP_ID=MMETSP0977-20130417/587_1 /TAXON_ID=483370 /ORGANISM="non described non described, Strain CCMP2097" /LENGTH=137 /DNA_ID=CAMNT_0026549233 /DNA_START=47 /DNA_END=459 /DNA_ORIENTATION=+